MLFVAPVVDEAFFQQPAIVEKGVDRQQLHRRDAQRAEMFQHRLRGEGLIAAAQCAGHLLPKTGEPLGVGLVDDGLRPGGVRPFVGRYRRGGGRHHAFRHCRRAVHPREREVALRRCGIVAETGVTEVKSPLQGTGIGVEQQLVGVEAVTALRAHRARGRAARRAFRARDPADSRATRVRCVRARPGAPSRVGRPWRTGRARSRSRSRRTRRRSPPSASQSTPRGLGRPARTSGLASSFKSRSRQARSKFWRRLWPKPPSLPDGPWHGAPWPTRAPCR